MRKNIFIEYVRHKKPILTDIGFSSKIFTKILLQNVLFGS